MNQDILVPNVDVPLLRKQYEWMVSESTTGNGFCSGEGEPYGIIHLLEDMLDIAELDNRAARG